jgi:hypothetical protein
LLPSFNVSDRESSIDQSGPFAGRVISRSDPGR